MALFAREKEEFLRQFLKLENGLPSHDSFSRVLRLLDPESFGDCFQKFMDKFSAACQGVVALMARFCGAPSTRPAASCRSRRSPPGAGAGRHGRQVERESATNRPG
jgi:hypothetical protein